MDEWSNVEFWPKCATFFSYLKLILQYSSCEWRHLWFRVDVHAVSVHSCYSHRNFSMKFWRTRQSTGICNYSAMHFFQKRNKYIYLVNIITDIIGRKIISMDVGAVSIRRDPKKSTTWSILGTYIRPWMISCMIIGLAKLLPWRDSTIMRTAT